MQFNFVGKLLGPGGSSFQNLQSLTKTRMAILGRGSMKDKRQEDDLRSSQHPDHEHLHDGLHVEISTLAQPAEAHQRIATAITEVTDGGSHWLVILVL